MGQEGQNVVLSFKAQGALGTPASGSSGIVFRATAGNQFAYEAAEIVSQEIRKDGQSILGRLGSVLARTELTSELSVDGYDEFLEAALRGTWVAAIDLDEATDAGGTLGAVVISSAVVTMAGGSLITAGLRAGMMVKFTNLSVAGNNDKWVRVIAVTALTFTVPTGALEDNASDAAWDLQIARHLYQADPPTERYWTVDLYLQTLDLSLTLTDAKVAALGMNIQPDQHIGMTFRLVGRDVVPNASGDSPTLTTPTESTGRPLVLLDGTARLGSTDETLTGFSWSLDSGGQGLPLITSRESPDIYLSNARGSGSLSAPVASLARFTALRAETEFSTFLVANENETDPADFVSFYMGQCAYRGPYNLPVGNQGALIETANFNFGKDLRGTGYQSTMMLISTSAS